jgi:hypothetical protein
MKYIKFKKWLQKPGNIVHLYERYLRIEKHLNTEEKFARPGFQGYSGAAYMQQKIKFLEHKNNRKIRQCELIMQDYGVTAHDIVKYGEDI